MDGASSNESVVIFNENAVGVVLERNFRFSKVRYTDLMGIEHEEYLSDEDYIEYEEWVNQ